MKTKLFILLAALSINAMANEPNFSMYKSTVKKSMSQKLFKSESRVTGKLVAASAGFIILGGITQGISAALEAPIYDPASNNYEGFTNKYNQWRKDQVTFKLTSAGLFTVGGVFLLFVGDDLINAKINDNSASTLKIKTSQNGIGLCLNFK